jgi:hypothetical protein
MRFDNEINLTFETKKLKFTCHEIYKLSFYLYVNHYFKKWKHDFFI